MMKFLLVLIFTGIFFGSISCNQRKQNNTSPAIITRDTANYFPLNSFIEEQSRFVDLRNLMILRTITQNGKVKKDIISKHIFFTELLPFKTLATDFTTQKKHYKETVFQDLGTESYTLNYLSTNSNLSIQRIDILLRAETNTVKQLFARRVFQKSDSSITQQFSFSTDKKMEISTEYSIHNSKPNREIRVIEWVKE
jgi:hypothetical protein